MASKGEAKGKPKGGAKTSMIQAPIMTQAYCFIHYVPKDRWKEAIDFFETIVGLMLRLDTGQGWAEFNAGGFTFALHEGSDLKPVKTGMVFAADDCDIAVEQLRARKVKGVTDPKGVTDKPEDGRCFDFLDPFGNQFGGYGK